MRTRLTTYAWEIRKLLAQRRTLVGLRWRPRSGSLRDRPGGQPGQAGPRRADRPRRLHLARLQHLRPGAAADRPVLLDPGPDAPAVALVAGDIVATEDGNHTLKTVLTRSTPRLDSWVRRWPRSLRTSSRSWCCSGSAAPRSAPSPAALTRCRSAASRSAPPASPSGPRDRRPLDARPARPGLRYLRGPLLAVSAWGFALSTLTRNSGGAIVGMLVFSFANQIIGFLPSIPEGVTRGCSPTSSRPGRRLGTTIDTGPIWHALLVSVLYAVPPLLVSAWSFARRARRRRLSVSRR